MRSSPRGSFTVRLRLPDASEKQTQMEWFLRRGTVVEGPLAEGDLRDMVAAGTVTTDSFVSPDRREFRPLGEWERLSSWVTLSLVDARKPTALLGTEEPFLNRGDAPRATRATAVIGTLEESPAPVRADRLWPGAAQGDPDKPQTKTKTKTKTPSDADPRELEDRNFFETVPADSPTVPESAPSPLDQPPLPETVVSPNRPGEALLRAPLVQRGAHYVDPVPAPRILPVRKSGELWPIVITAALVLTLCTLGALAAERLMRGPKSSNISRYLPAGAPYYVEVPSMKRWAAGLTSVAFFRQEDRALEEFLKSISEELDRNPHSLVKQSLLSSIEAFAFTQVEGELLYAVHYNESAAMREYLDAFLKNGETTEWGKRYRNSAGNTCLWLEVDRVEICGSGAALDASIEVLADRAPSAQEDAFLNAGKQRPFWSHLPFADVPAFIAVGNQALFANESAFADLSLATLTGGLDRDGYFEKVDLVFRAGKAPRSLNQGAPLTLWRELPQGTVFYTSFHARFWKDSQEFDEDLEGAVTLPPGAPSLEKILEQVRETLGFHPAELTQGLASEGLFAVTLDPDQNVTHKGSEKFPGAVWLHLTIDDHAQVRRTLSALVERLSGEQSTLSWKDENNLVGSVGSEARIHLSLERNLLRLGIGSETELARVYRSPGLLVEDLAHQTAVAALDDEISAFGWLDWGRLMAEPVFASGLPKQQQDRIDELRRAVNVTGPSRPTASFFVKQLESGDLRIRSRNLPTGFLLFLLGTLGQPKDGPESDADPISRPGNDASPPKIGPGPDGSFDLPPPSEDSPKSLGP